MLTQLSDSSGELPARIAETPPSIDGILEPGEWESYARGEGLIDRDTGKDAPETGQFWLAYDQNYIYFAYRAADSRPETVQTNQFRRNASLAGDDSVTFSIDPFGNLSNFNSFSVNPAGAYSLGIAGGRAGKLEWIGEIKSAGRRTESGWEVEARIPWNLMRLPSPGARTARVNVSRYMPRFQRDFVWRDTSQGRIENTGSWKDVVIPPAQSGRSIQLLPYGYLGAGRDKSLYNTGLDLRLPVTDQIEAVATVNPDFRNVENEVLSLDLSFFERLAGETRPFFREGSGFFQTGFRDRLFASQRIRSFDVGAKTYGRLTDRQEFGVMALSTLDRQAATVASYTYTPTNRSNLNIATTSLREANRSNDAVWMNYGQGVGPLLVYYQAGATFDEQLGRGGSLEFGADYSVRNFTTYFNARMVERDYRPRLGFVNDTDFKGFASGLGIEQVYTKGPIQESEYYLNFTNYWRTDGTPYRRSASLYGSLTTRSAFDIDIDARISRFQNFDDHSISLSIEQPRRDPYRRWEYTYTNGRFSENPFQEHSLALRYRPFQRLQTSLTGEWQTYQGESRQLIFGTSWEMDLFQSISGRAVLRDNKINPYLSYNRAGGRGVEYFLIVGDPNALEFRSNVTLKAVFPIEIRL